MENLPEISELTEAEQAFCAALLTGAPSAVAAYRMAFDCEDMTESAVYSAASRLARRPEIQEHRAELQAAGMAAGILQLDSYVRMQLELSAKAAAAEQYSAAVKALEAAGRASGAHIDQHEHTHRTESAAEILQRIADRYGHDVAHRIARIRGITVDAEAAA